MTRFLIQRCIALALLLHILGACSSGGGSGGGSVEDPPAGDPVEVEFGSTAKDWEENGGHASVPLTKSSATPGPVYVPYTVGGTAVAGVHYVIDPGPIEIPPDATFTTLLVGILGGLPIFAPDVEVVVDLGSPTGAELGETTTHVLRIRNDDLFTEIEPNDEPETANPLDGDIGPGRAGTVIGTVTTTGGADPRDAFVLRAAESTQVEFVLQPESLAADVAMWFSRPGGFLSQVVDRGGAGAPERAVVLLESGQQLIVSCLTSGSDTAYELHIAGIGAGLVTADAGGDDPLARLGLDWDSAQRLWVERKRARAADLRLGRGTLLDLESGERGTVEVLVTGR